MNSKYYISGWIYLFAIGVWMFFTPLLLVAQQLTENDTLPWKRYPVEGFANKTSVIQGQSIDFMVANGDSGLVGTQYQMQVYRVGVSDSLVYTVPGTYSLQYQPLHDSTGAAIPRHQFTVKPREYKTGCNWSSVFTVPGNITNGWKSGFYFVKCSVSNPSVSRRFPFVVRQAVPGSTSRILYKVPFSTYQAYNSWGGSSLYWKDTLTLVQNNDTVSFLRPFGAHSGHLERTDIGSFDLAEKYFIQWAERSGYVMEYCTNLDLDFDGDDHDPLNQDPYGFITKYKFIVTSGHDEYWSQPERDDVEKYFIPNQLLGGGNAAFLSGNVCYWRAKYANNRTRIFCHKFDSANDYRWRFSNSADTANPEARFIGIQFDLPESLNWHYYGKVDTMKLPTHWLYKGINPTPNSGDVFGYGYTDPERVAASGIVGGEVDRVYSGYSPSNVEIISAYTFSNGIHHDAGFYINTQSNARVFGAGSIYWSRGFKGSDSVKYKTIMTNLMDHFSEKKFVGDIYSPPAAPLTWRDSVEIDGKVDILQSKQLTLTNNMTLTIDALDTLFVNGTLELKDNVNIIGSGIIKVNPSGTMKITRTIPEGWNMVSVPDTVPSLAVSSVWHGAVSQAFSYGSTGYTQNSNATYGVGYWVKYPHDTTISYVGKPVFAESINVAAGWNMIGFISQPLNATRMISIPPGIVTSDYFRYSSATESYSPATVLYPGNAYWVKSSAAGKIVFNTSSSSNVSITAIDPCPPEPPEIPTLTAPVLSCASCVPDNKPTLSWTLVSGATNYQLWQYTCPWSSTECEPVASVIYSGPATSCTDQNYTVFKKTGSNPTPTTILSYYVVAHNNFCQSSPNSNTVNINSGDDPIVYKQGRKGTEAEERQLPTVTKLDANYPNPFNPTTTISYQLASPGIVSMRVYNVLGEEIARLVESELEPGYYTTEWQASSSSSGIYYLRMIVTDQGGKQTYQAMKKLLLMK